MTLAKRKKAWVEGRVKELRESGLTDAAIARRMGISPSTFNEAVKSDGVSDAFVQKLADAFGVPFTLEETPGSSERSTTDAEVKEELRAVKHLLNALLDRVGPKP